MLKFDEKSVDIFKYLFNTKKNIKLYGISGDDYDKIDEELLSQAPYTQYNFMQQPSLHNTCIEFLNKFNPIHYDKYDVGFDPYVEKIVILYPETGMSIREQQNFVNAIIKHILLFDVEQNDFEIIIVTHSLFILTDIPSGNVTAFNKEECSSPSNLYFGASLYDVLSNFSPDISMGRLSADYASKIIKIANDVGSGKKNAKKNIPSADLVNYIGDKIIRGYIKHKFDKV